MFLAESSFEWPTIFPVVHPIMHISPHIPSYPRISPHIPAYPLISRHIPSYPLISPHIPAYPHISPHIPSYPLILYIILKPIKKLRSVVKSYIHPVYMEDFLTCLTLTPSSPLYHSEFLKYYFSLFIGQHHCQAWAGAEPVERVDWVYLAQLQQHRRQPARGNQSDHWCCCHVIVMWLQIGMVVLSSLMDIATFEVSKY